MDPKGFTLQNPRPSSPTELIDGLFLALSFDDKADFTHFSQQSHFKGEAQRLECGPTAREGQGQIRTQACPRLTETHLHHPLPPSHPVSPQKAASEALSPEPRAGGGSCPCGQVSPLLTMWGMGPETRRGASLEWLRGAVAM